jgi:hypothetical protein
MPRDFEPILRPVVRGQLLAWVLVEKRQDHRTLLTMVPWYLLIAAITAAVMVVAKHLIGEPGVIVGLFAGYFVLRAARIRPDPSGACPSRALLAVTPAGLLFAGVSIPPTTLTGSSIEIPSADIASIRSGKGRIGLDQIELTLGDGTTEVWRIVHRPVPGLAAALATIAPPLAA